MLTAIFSDIHSNLQAYETVIDSYKKKGIEKLYCVGDIVGYGANPKECIEITKSLNCPIVCGNHDWAVAGKIKTDYFNQRAKAAVIWTKEHLGQIDKNYLGNLPLVYEKAGITLVHGTLDDPEAFDYTLDLRTAMRTLHLLKTKLCFIGHSHAPGVFYETEDGYIDYTTKSDVSLDEKRQYLINVGSVGQPRDSDYRACYCIYDDKNKTLHFERLEYDVEEAQRRILNSGLPPFFAHRLASGR